MNQVLEKIIFFGFTIFIFIVLWKVTGELWDAFVPWNYKTDLLGIFVVAPILIVSSFILSSYSFKVIKGSK
jgi:heme/copper-type cytochrome/quinol oxidase subunit 2